jgi:hypothetical protein
MRQSSLSIAFLESVTEGLDGLLHRPGNVCGRFD